MAVLLAARVAQGWFTGLMVPQVLSFIHVKFPKEEQATAMGLFGMTFPIGGLAAAVGAVVVMPALVAVLYPLMEGRELDRPLWTFGLLAAAVPLLAVSLSSSAPANAGARNPWCGWVCSATARWRSAWS